MATIQNLNFNPTSISGCALWLDASDRNTLSLVGTLVNQWNDKSGNERNATAIVSPTYSGNSIVFNGSATGFTTSLSASTNVESGFIVAQCANIGGSNTILGGGNILSGGRQFRIATNIIQTIKQDVEAVLATGASLSNNTVFLLEYVNNGTTLTHYNNGSSYASGSSLAYSAGITTSIGRRSDTQESYNGSINEIIVYSTALSNTQRQQVEGYLAWKWGLQGSLPVTHPYYYAPPNSAGLVYPMGLRIPAPIQSFSSSSNAFVFFNPRSITGCSLWLDAADTSQLVFTGANVTTWRDKSGNGYNATGYGATTYSVFNTAQNGINLNGVNTYFNYTGGSAINNTPNLSAFVVATFNSATPSSARLLGFGDTDWNSQSNAVAFTRYGGANQIVYERALVPTPSLTFTLPLQFVGSIVFNSSSINQFVNGSSNASSSSSFASFNYSLYNVGRFSGGGLNWNGMICEVIAYNASLSTSQRQQVEGYLAWKWGLQTSLPSNHPFKNNPPGLTIPIPVFTTRFFQQTFFSPKNISGLALWLDATDPNGDTTSLSNNATVSTWFDKSGIANNGTGGAASFQLNRLNNLPGIVFNGSTSYTLAKPGSLSTGQSQGSSMFVIVQSTNSSPAEQGIFAQSPATPGACDRTGRILFFSGNSTRVEGTMYCTFARTSNAYTLNQTNLYSDLYTNTGVGSYLHNTFVNGNPFSLTSASITGANTSAFIAQVGALNVVSTNLVGTIFEVIYYTNTLTTAQRQNIEGYLAWKWGLQGSLPATHPFKNFAPPPN